jgi:hypothetical protein
MGKLLIITAPWGVVQTPEAERNGDAVGFISKEVI